jgi:hypothetical protein
MAAQWKLGANAARVLEMLPDDRREAVLAAIRPGSATEDLAKRIAGSAAREERRLTLWGRRRYGASIWDRLDPRVRKHLVQKHGRDH